MVSRIIFLHQQIDLLSADIVFRLMATHFFFNSKKEVGKKMPPRKLIPLRGPLCSSSLAGSKELVA